MTPPFYKPLLNCIATENPPLSIFRTEKTAPSASATTSTILRPRSKPPPVLLPVLIEIAESMSNVKIHMMVYKEDGMRYSVDYFRKTLSDHGDFYFYLCSSPRVRSIVFKALTALGVKKSAIHYEAFSFG